jgi:hypothetical protein
VDFPRQLKAGRTYTIDFYYSGTPKRSDAFGGFTLERSRPTATGFSPRVKAKAPASGGPTKISGKMKSSRCSYSRRGAQRLTDVSNGKFLG